MSYGTEADPIEIMEGAVLSSIQGVKKEDVRIKYIGTNKILTWKEHMADAKKWDKKREKAKLTAQISALPDAVKDPSPTEADHDTDQEKG